jgi:hypothetical protein
MELSQCLAKYKAIRAYKEVGIQLLALTMPLHGQWPASCHNQCTLQKEPLLPKASLDA